MKQETNTIRIGVIADDFTGASDAASFLVNSGNRTILLTSLSERSLPDCDCVVIALKVRSVPPEEAIKEVEKVMDYFDGINVEKVYFKYCSTFDSTPKGNIGTIMDYLMERMNVTCSVLCPSLPVNGRTVEKGILYVNGIPLAESPMKDHPLNPMWDSFIPALMSDQSRYPCYPVSIDGVDSIITDNTNEHYYLIPDYRTDEDGRLIADRFKDLTLLSGGSGLLEHLIKGDHVDDEYCFDIGRQKAIILSGSCSAMTKRQVHNYRDKDGPCISIDADKLLSGMIDKHAIMSQIIDHLPDAVLVYSDGCDIPVDRDDILFAEKSMAMESFLAELALEARKNGFNKIIVAGGETSGAVITKIAYNSFYVGTSVAPGVPVLIPADDTDVRIILKSGNFGDDDFFTRALKAQ